MCIAFGNPPPGFNKLQPSSVVIHHLDDGMLCINIGSLQFLVALLFPRSQSVPIRRSIPERSVPADNRSLPHASDRNRPVPRMAGRCKRQDGNPSRLSEATDDVRL